MKDFVKDNPAIYLREIAVVFSCCQAAMRKALNRLGITRKKTTHYYEQDPEKVKEYLERIKDMFKEQVAYVDESGLERCFLFFRAYYEENPSKVLYVVENLRE